MPKSLNLEIIPSKALPLSRMLEILLEKSKIFVLIGCFQGSISILENETRPGISEMDYFSVLELFIFILHLRHKSWGLVHHCLQVFFFSDSVSSTMSSA